MARGHSSPYPGPNMAQEQWHRIGKLPPPLWGGLVEVFLSQ
jgi:hypothetical protein